MAWKQHTITYGDAQRLGPNRWNRTTEYIVESYAKDDWVEIIIFNIFLASKSPQLPSEQSRGQKAIDFKWKADVIAYSACVCVWPEWIETKVPTELFPFYSDASHRRKEREKTRKCRTTMTRIFTVQRLYACMETYRIVQMRNDNTKKRISNGQ